MSRHTVHMTPEEKTAVAQATVAAVAQLNTTVEDISKVIRGRVARGLSVLGLAGRIPMAAVNATHTAVHAGIGLGIAGVGSLVEFTLAARSNQLAPPLADAKVGLQTQAMLGAAFGESLPTPLTPPLQVFLPDEIEGYHGLVVFSHGLGGHEQQWGTDYAVAVASAGLVPAFVRYPTGHSIDTNAADLARCLAEIVRDWPGPLNRIVLVGHSMGGLISARAVQLASPDEPWVSLVSDVITLGSPQLGAPLERVSDALLNAVIAISQVAAPIARLGHHRSRGIKDLGPGLAEPVPDHLSHTAVVAAIGATSRTAASTLLGDGIVPVSSAKGHRPVAPHVTVVEYTRTHHQRLLNHPGVTELLWQIATQAEQ